MNLGKDVIARYRWQMCWALTMAVTDGILANAPMMALLSMGAKPKHLGIRLALSSIGMFASVWLGWWMARRSKKPFVIVPGVFYALGVVLMTLTNHPLIFLTLFGVVLIFEYMARPAVTSVVRTCYPAEVRSTLMGRIRSMTSLVFLCSTLGAAFVLDRYSKADGNVNLLINLLLYIGVGFVGLSLVAFWKIQIPKDGSGEREAMAEAGKEVVPWRTIRKDKRLHRYLFGGAFKAFGGLLYVSYVPGMMTENLQLGYLMTALCVHVLPTAVQCVSVAPICAWLDKVNVWRGWMWVRFLWSLDALMLGLALVLPVGFHGAIVLVILGRLLRGSAMGGSWVLWWQTGIHQIAPPGADTSRYMSVQTIINGVLRLSAPLTGMLLLEYGSIELAMFAAAGIMLSSVVYTRHEAQRESREEIYKNTASYEKSFEKEPVSAV